MKHEMFIVKHNGKHHGPFISYEVEFFVSKLKGEAEVIPLFVPRLPEEEGMQMKLKIMEDDGYRAHVDSFKIDTHHMLAGIIQRFFFARRDDRVLTVREIRETWGHLFRISRAVESLMHYVDKVVADPCPGNVEAMRKAFWRNRDSDDVDPHYADRFW